MREKKVQAVVKAKAKHGTKSEHQLNLDVLPGWVHEKEKAKAKAKATRLQMRATGSGTPVNISATQKRANQEAQATEHKARRQYWDREPTIFEEASLSQIKDLFMGLKIKDVTGKGTAAAATKMSADAGVQRPEQIAIASDCDEQGQQFLSLGSKSTEDLILSVLGKNCEEFLTENQA